MRSLWFLLLSRFFSVYQIFKNEMGGIVHTYGRQDRCMWDFGGDNIVKASLGRRWCRWENIIKLYLQDVELRRHGLE
jgi:hypothetical protein